MSEFSKLKDEFIKYNPIIFNINNFDKINIFDGSFDVQFSNNICYPEFRLGFQHYIHQAKDKMEIVEQFATRKKIYLVTSLFEKNIDYKTKTENEIDFISIDDGVKNFIKEINPNFPPLLNRAFLKMWEMIIMFDLIPDSITDNFTSSHLAEGPGSFIQATILYRDLQVKLKKIKSTNTDNYYGVTLYSDHEHLQMQKKFINFFEQEKKKRLHIMETKSIKEIRDMYGGGGKKIEHKITNGDLTKLNTIIQFSGGKDVESFTKPSDLVTADGGFDWKKENLQEQEAYKLIFGEIITALKVQKDKGNFVIKIFESYTSITIKFIEILRFAYEQVYICKPYTSRISNSEKYIICKDFNKKKITNNIIHKLEDMLDTINKNEKFNILNIFTDIIISPSIYNFYKKINEELLIKQYIGINNIIKFINLDSYNGIEYNQYLDKQIEASHFWNDLFLNTDNFSKLYKYLIKYDFLKYKESFLEKDIYEIESKVTKIELKENNIESENKLSRQIESKKKITKLKINKSKIQNGGTIFYDTTSSSENIIIENDSIDSEEYIVGVNSTLHEQINNQDFIDLSFIPI